MDRNNKDKKEWNMHSDLYILSIEPLEPREPQLVCRPKQVNCHGLNALVVASPIRLSAGRPDANFGQSANFGPSQGKGCHGRFLARKSVINAYRGEAEHPSPQATCTL